MTSLHTVASTVLTFGAKNNEFATTFRCKFYLPFSNRHNIGNVVTSA